MADFVNGLEAASEMSAHVSRTKLLSAMSRVLTNLHMQNVVGNALDVHLASSLNARTFENVACFLSSWQQSLSSAMKEGGADLDKTLRLHKYVESLGKLSGVRHDLWEACNVGKAISSNDPVKLVESILGAIAGATAFALAGSLGTSVISVFVIAAGVGYVLDQFVECFPQEWKETVSGMLFDVYDGIWERLLFDEWSATFGKWPIKELNPFGYQCWGDVESWHPHLDLIALGLDGNDLETTAVENWETVRFDQNGDCLKTATGWL
jgi:hypothetical protein